jgi:curved DNA-binding protein CbpA
MNSGKKNHYTILGLDQANKHRYTKAEIAKAYRTRALVYHPDKTSAANAIKLFQELSIAYEVLSDDTKRNIYNARLDDESEEHKETKRPLSEEDILYNDLMQEIKHWPEKNRREYFVDFFKNYFQKENFIKNLMILIKNRKLEYNQFSLLKNDLIFKMVQSDDIVAWICSENGRPSLSELSDGFLSARNQCSEEKADIDNLKVDFNIYLAAKILNDDRFFLNKKNNLLERLRRHAISSCVLHGKVIKHAWDMVAFFEEISSQQYIQKLNTTLIQPFKEKMEILSKNKDEISAEKVKALKFILFLVEKDFGWLLLVYMSTYEYNKQDKSKTANKVYLELIQKNIIDYINDMDASIINKHKNGIRSFLLGTVGLSIEIGIISMGVIYGGLAGALIGIVIAGIVFASSRFRQLFFYTNTRILLDRTIEKLNKIYKAELKRQVQPEVLSDEKKLNHDAQRLRSSITKPAAGEMPHSIHGKVEEASTPILVDNPRTSNRVEFQFSDSLMKLYSVPKINHATLQTAFFKGYSPLYQRHRTALLVDDKLPNEEAFSDKDRYSFF